MRVSSNELFSTLKIRLASIPGPHRHRIYDRPRIRKWSSRSSSSSRAPSRMRPACSSSSSSRSRRAYVRTSNRSGGDEGLGSRLRSGQRRQSLRRATVFHTNKKMSEEEGKRKTSFSLPKALCFFIDTKENNVHTGFFAVSQLRSSSVCAYITGRAWLWSVLLLKELLLFPNFRHGEDSPSSFFFALRPQRSHEKAWDK